MMFLSCCCARSFDYSFCDRVAHTLIASAGDKFSAGPDKQFSNLSDLGNKIKTDSSNLTLHYAHLIPFELFFHLFIYHLCVQMLNVVVHISLMPTWIQDQNEFYYFAYCAFSSFYDYVR